MVQAEKPSSWPKPPELAATAYLLWDVTSEQILAEHQADTPIEPASLTKLMTAYLVFDALKSGKIQLDQVFPVSERAWRMKGSLMFIDPSMKVRVDDLLKGMIVQSGNDATVALAEGVGGSVEQFVVKMNAMAVQLGMKSTQYHNPEGLTIEGHQTTARDLMRLATRLMHDFPEHVHYYAIKQYRYPGTPTSNDTNRNKLLFQDPTVDGLKTGHTDAAGYCLIATANRPHPNLPNQGKRRLLSVVLGTVSEQARADESHKLLEWGYQTFEPVVIAQPQQVWHTLPLWEGVDNQIALGWSDGWVVTVPTGMRSNLKVSIHPPSVPLIAPMEQGQLIKGHALVALTDGSEIAQRPLMVLKSVPLAGWFGRMWDKLGLVKQWITSIF